MNKNDIKELKKLLTKWFDNTDLAARNVFNTNEIAKLIKDGLKDNGNWKDKPRGHKNKSVNNIDNLKINKPKEVKIEVKVKEDINIKLTPEEIEQKENTKLRRQYLHAKLNYVNELAEFKRNHEKDRDGSYHIKCSHVNDYFTKEYKDIKYPPTEPPDTFEEWLKNEQEDIF